jgi:cyclin-dependent kinase 8/11
LNTNRPIDVVFQGIEDKSNPNPFQLDQLDKIFKVLGNPTPEKWPTLTTLPHWQNNRNQIQSRKYENPGLYSIVQLPPKSAGFDLLSRMLEYDPTKRITAAQALEHEYFRNEPIPGRNSLVPGLPGQTSDKVNRATCLSLSVIVDVWVL